jgi:hypothetical protein
MLRIAAEAEQPPQPQSPGWAKRAVVKLLDDRDRGERDVAAKVDEGAVERAAMEGGLDDPVALRALEALRAQAVALGLYPDTDDRGPWPPTQPVQAPPASPPATAPRIREF